MIKGKTLWFLLSLVLISAFFIVRYFYFKPDVIYGDQAPDFVFTDLEGQKIALSDFRGKYVLLSFWGSWCGPCRMENPKLVSLYKKYGSHDSFELISIGIETNTSAWTKAIANDHLFWKNHYTDGMRFSSEIARSYGVKSIPSKFLIDKEGHTVLVNVTIDEIDSYLSDHLE